MDCGGWVQESKPEDRSSSGFGAAADRADEAELSVVSSWTLGFLQAADLTYITDGLGLELGSLNQIWIHSAPYRHLYSFKKSLIKKNCFESLLTTWYSPEGADFKDQQDPPPPPLANRGLMLGTHSNCREASHSIVHIKANTQPSLVMIKSKSKDNITNEVEKGAFDVP